LIAINIKSFLFGSKLFDINMCVCNNALMKQIKTIIQTLRKGGYSQEHLAKVAGVSQMSISRWVAKSPKLVNISAYRKLEKLLENTPVKPAR